MVHGTVVDAEQDGEVNGQAEHSADSHHCRAVEKCMTATQHAD